MRVHLVANIHRPDALEAASGAAETLRGRGSEVGLEIETARAMGLPAVATDRFADADLVVAFGGDGTLIRAAHLCAPVGTPILGVYYGTFGFVTQCTSRTLAECIEDFLAGRIEIDQRSMLEGELLRHGRPVATLFALNEIALQRAVTARMLTFGVTIDGLPVTQYPADGVIVSTPTGSTAYSLSAGGPIVDPSVDALLFTPLAPHTLSARPLVLKPSSEIRLRIEQAGDAVVSADAQTRLHLLAGDEVRVTKSSRVTNLVAVEKDDFLVKLRQRLFWSKGWVGEEA